MYLKRVKLNNLELKDLEKRFSKEVSSVRLSRKKLQEKLNFKIEDYEQRLSDFSNRIAELAEYE